MSIAGTVVLLLVVGSAYRAMVANNRLHDAERDFEAARSALVETRTADVVAALDRAEANLRAARRSATSFPLNLTEPVPLLGSPARAVKDVTTAGNELVAAARELNDAVDTFPTSAEVSLEGHDITALGTAARRSTPVVRGATERLRRAQQAIDGAKGAALPFISRPARGMSETLRDAERTLDGARRGLALVETIAAPTSRLRLLVVSQDSMELRPSGGYIGSYGMMEIANGTAVLTDFAATEDLARPDPPLPPPPDMAPGYTRWLIEDAGWWPDFPTSASSIREVYAAQGGGDVDGVLALTEHAMARLVGTLGEITVPGYAEPVREQGFDERVLYEVELKRPLDTPRKRFLVELSKIVFDRVLSLPAEKVPAAMRTLGASVGAGDVQLWFKDRTLSALISPLAIGGHLPPADRDFLKLVDANLVIGKANAGVTKEVEYHVRRRSDGVLQAEVSILVRNTRPKSPINSHYGSFLRLYTPLGTRLLDTTEARDEGRAPDGPYHVFSLDLRVEPLSERRYRVRYELPQEVATGGHYRLRWDRQPGTQRDVFRAVIGSTTHSFESSGSVVVEGSLSRNRVAEWLRRRWIWRALAD